MAASPTALNAGANRRARRLFEVGEETRHTFEHELMISFEVLLVMREKTGTQTARLASGEQLTILLRIVRMMGKAFIDALIRLRLKEEYRFTGG